MISSMLLHITSILYMIILYTNDINATVITGFTTDEKFQYVGKFCFDSKPTKEQVAGRIQGQIQTSIYDIQVAIYDHENYFWNHIMGNKSCDCECKTSTNHTKEVYNIPSKVFSSTPFTFTYDIHQHMSPRFWYVAIAQCSLNVSDKRNHINLAAAYTFEGPLYSTWYSFHITQEDGSELSMPEIGLPFIYGASTAISMIAAIIQLVSEKKMTSLESFHPITNLLTLILFAYLIATGLLFLHYILYEHNGVGFPLLRYLAEIIHVFVRVSTILMSMLIAEGWTITNTTFQDQGNLMGFIFVIAFLYLSMCTWYLVLLNPSSTVYIYDSWPGVGICILHLVLLAWFLYTISITRSHEQTKVKRTFFLQMGALFTLYLLSLPTIALIASILSQWVREKITAYVTNIVNLSVYLTLIYYLWPSNAPHQFQHLPPLLTTNVKARLRGQYQSTENH